MVTYIHYGHKEFDINKFETPKNRAWCNKPRGGFWASRTDAKHGWKHWCEQEAFCHYDGNCSFTFSISDKANILYINCVEDVYNLPEQEQYTDSCIRSVDFEQLIANGIDAIEFNISNDWNLYMALYGWDCDSTLILNPSIIEVIQ